MIDWSLLHPAEARAAAATAALRDRIKARRDAAITGGLRLEGMAIATDDVSQQRLTAAALAALLDPDLVLQWKLPDGRFIPLQAAQVIAIAQAVRAHVQACFDHEAQLLAALARRVSRGSGLTDRRHRRSCRTALPGPPSGRG